MEDSDEEPLTRVLLLKFKYGINVGRVFKFKENARNLTISSSPVGAAVNEGDVIVKWRRQDVRHWTPQTFREKLEFVNRSEHIEAWIYRRGFNPQDLHENTPVSAKIIPKFNI